MQEDLRLLSLCLLSAQEDERKISRDVHDVIVQILKGINLRLSAASGAICTTEHVVRTQDMRSHGFIPLSMSGRSKFA